MFLIHAFFFSQGRDNTRKLLATENTQLTREGMMLYTHSFSAPLNVYVQPLRIFVTIDFDRMQFQQLNHFALFRRLKYISFVSCLMNVETNRAEISDNTH